MIGKEKKRLNLLKALHFKWNNTLEISRVPKSVEDLEQKDGPELTMLLRNSECSDMQNRYCTCKDFLDSSLTVYKTIELTKDRVLLALLQLRIDFLKSLRKKVIFQMVERFELNALTASKESEKSTTKCWNSR